MIKEHTNEADYLDHEWILLIQEAFEMGLNIEEIKQFIFRK